MAWSGCNTSSEFIEILNFGPGPMDIGCYIVTNGAYSVTIPPNTILQAGQYFVLSGQSILLKDCGNVDSTIVVDLNWNTCNCIDKPITSSDGFMTDGGSANEKVVILDPQLNVIDAVSRKLPQSSSISITTATLSGACTSKTFDLDLMGITYENIGQSTGINNSYSRKVDGDCGWEKTPAISAKAPNKTGSTSSATYTFSTLSASECNATTGSIAITVNAPDVASLFPMNYLLAYDADSNGVFSATDTYKYGIDSTAANIDINKLAYGRYRITVGSVLGCNLKTFDFMIFNCYGILLPLQLRSFVYKGLENTAHVFDAGVTGIQHLKSISLEGYYGGDYKVLCTKNISAATFDNDIIRLNTTQTCSYYRLSMLDDKNSIIYSRIIAIKTPQLHSSISLWPNPALTGLKVSFQSSVDEMLPFSIKNMQGAVIKRGEWSVHKGRNDINLPVNNLVPGIYQLSVLTGSHWQPISARFVKQ